MKNIGNKNLIKAFEKDFKNNKKLLKDVKKVVKSLGKASPIKLKDVK